MKPKNETENGTAGVAFADCGFSILTKYLRPTDFRGARVKAVRAFPCPGPAETVTVGFHSVPGCPHEAAARQWFARFRPGQSFHLAKATVPAGHVFTVIFSSHETE
jgi:hypothetical protein